MKWAHPFISVTTPVISPRMRIANAKANTNRQVKNHCIWRPIGNEIGRAHV